MDCAQFREIVHDLDRADTAGFAMRRSALEHADNCGECNAVLGDVELLDSALSRIAAQDAGKQAPARVEAALLAEFRRRAAAVEAVPKKEFTWAALGIAAAFLLMLGVGLHYWIAGRSNISQQSANQGARQAEQRAGSDAAKSSGAASADDGDATYATDFVSLPYADDPATLQDATIVRVVLSRSALASFGVPVADLDPGDQIPADIALSEDGAPQAIRLVAEDESESGN